MPGPDPLDLLKPGELAQEAGRHLQAALAALEEVGRSLRGEALPPREAPSNVPNVLPFTIRSRKTRRDRNAVA